MAKDNRRLNKKEDEKLIKEIVEDDSPIPEDVDPSNHGDAEPVVPVEEDPVVEEDPIDLTKEVKKSVPKVKEDVDFEKKYSDSSREATALHFKNKKLEDTVEEASNLPEPSIEELKEYARGRKVDYDELDDFSQSILKDMLTNSKRFKMIHETTRASKKIDDWAKSVDEFSNSAETIAKYPSLSDSDLDFRKYCMKEQRRGVDMEDLVASFLFKRQKDDPAPKPKKKKSMLLDGGGGGDGVPKSKKITAEEARVIREKNPRRYKKLIKEGKLNIDLLDGD